MSQPLLRRSHSRKTSNRRRKLQAERFEPRIALAADIAVIDANTVPLAGITQSVFNGSVELGGKIYYRDSDPQFGAELFAYDPATNASRRVTDWNTGQADSIANLGDLSFVAKAGNKLFFSISAGALGQELGVYDADSDSTRILDAVPGTGSSSPLSTVDIPGNAAVYGNRLYFASETIYWFDFSNPLSRAVTLNTTGMSSIRNLTIAGNKLFFTSQISGVEKLRWVDLNAGTQAVQTIELPNANSFGSLRVVGNRLYFVANDGAGLELRWVDATAVTPVINTIDLAPGTSSSAPSQLTSVNNRLYFSAFTNDIGNELRWIDLATSTAVQSLDSMVGTVSGNPTSLTVVGSKLYFVSLESATGTEVRWIDTTLTSLVVNTIDSISGTGGRAYEKLTASSTHMFMLANEFATGTEPYFFDLQASNPNVTRFDTFAGVLSAGPSNLLALGSRLFFGGEPVAGRDLIWIDASASPVIMNTIDIRDTNSSMPVNFFATEDKFFFSGTQAYGDHTIGWMPTKTMTPEVHWTPWAAGETPYFLPMFTQVGNKLFFVSTDASYGSELRWIDLDDATMTLHTMDVYPGATGSNPTALTKLGNKLFWTSYEPVTGKELRWVDASLSNPTVETIDISTTAFWGNPTDLMVHGDQLYFTAFDNTVGAELRRLDTSRPTWTIETFDTNLGSGNGFIGFSKVVIGNRLYFVGTDVSFTEQLRWIDTSFGSTTINTVAIANLNEISWLTAVNSRLYFRARDTLLGRELRWIDTSLASPVVNTLDFSPNTWSTEFDFYYPVVAGNRMFYSARNFLGEMELRWIDTTATNNITNTLDLGIGPADATSMTLIGGRIFMTANNLSLGRELAIVSPTQPTPTVQWEDLSAGNRGAVPNEFLQVGNRIYFRGYKLGSQSEIYIYSEALAPSTLTLVGNTVAENVPIGTNVGAFNSTDPNAGDTFTYALVPGLGDNDNAQFEIIGNQLHTNSAIDFETQSVYSVRVRSTDIDGLSIERTFTIQVQDINEAVYLVGTPGNDVIDFTLTGTALDRWLVRVNGNTVFDGLLSLTSNVFIDGLEGSDTFRMVGTANSDVMSVYLSAYTLNGNQITASNFEISEVLGDAGDDTVSLLSPFGGLVDGGLGMDRLQGPDTSNLWTIANSNAGTLNATTSYRNTESIVGGGLEDEFRFLAAGRLTGIVQGGNGLDSVDQSALAVAITLNGATKTATNTGGWDQIEIWRGSTTSSADRFIGRNSPSSYLLDGLDQAVIDNGELRIFQFENITGGTAPDQFVFLNESSRIRGTLGGGSGSDSISWTNWATPVNVNLATRTAPGVGQFTGFESLIGSPLADLLTGANSKTTWQITGLNTGKAGSTQFTGFENLQGNSNSDSFKLMTNTAKISGSVHGGGGNDTVTGPNSTTVWSINAMEAVFVNATQFNDIENLTGGTSSDRFQFASASASMPGSINGGSGSSDTLSWSDLNTPIDISLATFSANQVGRFSAIERFEGSQSMDRIIGSNSNNSWRFDGANIGAVGSLLFANVETALGGSGNDSFRFVGTASMAGGIDGGLGNDSITGPDIANNWQVQSMGAGSVNTSQFVGIENLTGGILSDEFSISTAGGLAGNLSGGAGVNSLSYIDWIVGVSVDLTSSLAGNATAILGLTSKIQSVVGGQGDDLLRGNLSVATTLLGNGGNDQLFGGSGRDLLIGGLGMDVVRGGSGEDLLIAGRTSFDLDQQQLRRIYDEWTSSRDFATRVANIHGTGTGPRLNGDTFLNSSTVLTDEVLDQVFGELNNDWFWSSPEEAVDLVGTDRRDDG